MNVRKVMFGGIKGVLSELFLDYNCQVLPSINKGVTFLHTFKTRGCSSYL